MRHSAAAAQLEIAQIMAEVNDRPHLNDKLEQVRSDLEFFNRVVGMMDKMLDNSESGWNWTVVNPTVIEETTELKTHHYA